MAIKVINFQELEDAKKVIRFEDKINKLNEFINY